VAIACSGIEPVSDRRATKDLDGNVLKVTFQATADNLASIANHKMGEGDETMPLAIIRNSDAKITDRKINPKEMAISHDECLYVRGLKN
jgi:F420-0:gamma-glutamyl ligase